MVAQGIKTGAFNCSDKTMNGHGDPTTRQSLVALANIALPRSFLTMLLDPCSLFFPSADTDYCTCQVLR